MADYPIPEAPSKEELYSLFDAISANVFTSPPNGTENIIEGLIVVIKSEWDSEYPINVVPDAFTGLARAEATFSKYEAPIKVWNRVRDEAIFKGKTTREIKDILYARPSFRECNNFRVTVAISILRYLIKIFGLKDPSILDPSAGWGDRELAAIALNLRYTGVDPNPALADGYRRMAQSYSNRTIEVFTDDFLKVTLKDKFDIVITSPPFYTLEDYSDDPNQSIIMYPKFGDWVHKFLKGFVKKAIEHLNDGGLLVLYINDVGKLKYVHTIKTYILTLGMSLCGSIYFCESGYKLREVLVWQKK